MPLQKGPLKSLSSPSFSVRSRKILPLSRLCLLFQQLNFLAIKSYRSSTALSVCDLASFFFFFFFGWWRGRVRGRRRRRWGGLCDYRHFLIWRRLRSFVMIIAESRPVIGCRRSMALDSPSVVWASQTAFSWLNEAFPPPAYSSHPYCFPSAPPFSPSATHSRVSSLIERSICLYPFKRVVARALALYQVEKNAAV